MSGMASLAQAQARALRERQFRAKQRPSRVLASVVLAIIISGLAPVAGQAGSGGTADKSVWAPPVRYLNIEQVEPPRDVRASAWRSPYCTTWNDGCDVCGRASVADRPTCTQMNPSNQPGSCQRHVIMCTSVDIRALDEVCATWFSYKLDLNAQRRLLAGETIRRIGTGVHNDWGRDGERYALMSSTLFGSDRNTLQSSQRVLGHPILGTYDIKTTICEVTYETRPPLPAK